MENERETERERELEFVREGGKIELSKHRIRYRDVGILKVVNFAELSLAHRISHGVVIYCYTFSSFLTHLSLSITCSTRQYTFNHRYITDMLQLN